MGEEGAVTEYVPGQDDIGRALDEEGVDARREARVLNGALDATKRKYDKDGDMCGEDPDWGSRIAALKHLHTLRRRDKGDSSSDLRKLVQKIYVQPGGAVQINAK